MKVWVRETNRHTIHLQQNMFKFKKRPGEYVEIFSRTICVSVLVYFITHGCLSTSLLVLFCLQHRYKMLHKSIKNSAQTESEYYYKILLKFFCNAHVHIVFPMYLDKKNELIGTNKYINIQIQRKHQQQKQLYVRVQFLQFGSFCILCSSSFFSSPFSFVLHLLDSNQFKWKCLQNSKVFLKL